jgi:HD-GYP domain-containing protein (c-di-GMP phosphodiesterase class II)
MYSEEKIILLTTDSELYSQIRGMLGSYEIVWQRFNASKLMMYIYELNPAAIIIDLDDCDYSIYKSLSLRDPDNYLPILTLHSMESGTPAALATDMEYYMSKSDMAMNLPYIIKIFTDFKRKYTGIKQCYSINDMINSKTDSLLKRFIWSEFPYFECIELLLNCVFYDNRQLINIPGNVVIACRGETDTQVEIYTFGNGGMVKDGAAVLLKDSNALFELGSSFENAIYMNYDIEETYRMSSRESLFDEELMQRLGEITNFAGYITTDTAMLGVNYGTSVSQFDAGIIKELCINYNLIQNIYTQMSKVNSAFIYTVNALSRASEVNDDDTGMHIKRVNAYSGLIAESLGLDKKYRETIAYSAQMHDVGKLSVPKNILTKPGELTQEEFDIMKKHTIIGAKIIGDSPQLKMASEIAISHHEKFDGSGYPFKKTGEDIPLSGRIVAMADIYDALRSARVYKPAYDHMTAYEIITKGDGRVMPQHFDPAILQIFKNKHMEFCEIYEGTK